MSEDVRISRRGFVCLFCVLMQVMLLHFVKEKRKDGYQGSIRTGEVRQHVC